MINETCQSSGVVTFAETLADGFVSLMNDHSVFVLFMAALGLFAIIGAVGDKIFQFSGLIFKVFIAIPLIVVVGLINNKERENRLKELGKIRSHLKKNPEKWKLILYRVLMYLALILFVIAVIYFYTKVQQGLEAKYLMDNITMNISGGL